MSHAYYFVSSHDTNTPEFRVVEYDTHSEALKSRNELRAAGHTAAMREVHSPSIAAEIRDQEWYIDHTKK